MLWSLRQGYERSGLFLYLQEEHMPPGAAGGDQQQRWRPLAARSLEKALSRHAVPASVRGSAFALRATPCDAARQSGVQRAEMHTALCERRSGRVVG